MKFGSREHIDAIGGRATSDDTTCGTFDACAQSVDVCPLSMELIIIDRPSMHPPTHSIHTTLTVWSFAIGFQCAVSVSLKRARTSDCYHAQSRSIAFMFSASTPGLRRTRRAQYAGHLSSTREEEEEEEGEEEGEEKEEKQEEMLTAVVATSRLTSKVLVEPAQC